jgi:hypothetical protein
MLPTPVIAGAVILLSHNSPQAKALEDVAKITMPCPAPATMVSFEEMHPHHVRHDAAAMPRHHYHHHWRHHHHKA